jgi:hypothetical protein
MRWCGPRSFEGSQSERLSKIFGRESFDQTWPEWGNPTLKHNVTFALPTLLTRVRMQYNKLTHAIDALARLRAEVQSLCERCVNISQLDRSV